MLQGLQRMAYCVQLQGTAPLGLNKPSAHDAAQARLYLRTKRQRCRCWEVLDHNAALTYFREDASWRSRQFSRKSLGAIDRLIKGKQRAQARVSCTIMS